MKNFLPFVLSHAFVFGGAHFLRDGPFSAAQLFTCGVAASLLALAWFDVGRVRAPLRPGATILRPGSRDRSSGRAIVQARRAA